MIPQSHIRNFSIIAHIDHGKSTLADRFLELTGTVEKRKMREQVLDMMDLERERGITIKLQPARMEYTYKGEQYLLNLIDTPGHVDFAYEVSRSLAAVEGTILLVDASQGAQAQTLANLNLARGQNLIIIPVVNKIDLGHAKVDEAIKEISQLTEVGEEDVIKISAKSGLNVERVLEEVIKKIPAPTGEFEKPLRALIFDSSYDTYKGVIAYIRIVDGEIKRGDKVEMFASGVQTEVIEVGVFRPMLVKIETLRAGETGYVATGLKEIGQCRVGDTITVGAERRKKVKVLPLPGYKEPSPLIFASFYPVDANDYDLLKDGLAKLNLSDASLVYEIESCEGLGRGFRCGFLGMLHLEIVSERLKREYDLDLVTTSPSVSYRILDDSQRGYQVISSASDFPDASRFAETQEPWINLEIITPVNYLGQTMKILENLRGIYGETQYLSSERVLIKYEAPLGEIIIDFYDKLKNVTAGYASMSYELSDYRPADLTRLDILIAGEKAEAFSRIVPRAKADQEGRALVKKLKEVIPSQLFTIALQAAIGGKVIARETISALRKDVTGYLYGGDYSRKRKLLEKQKKGKKKMMQSGRVNIPSDVFLKVLKK
ncbi:translation elongation factor 4 [Patescibacteria group bacterium]|nr:translation elongation factor 4 [Patescibacteria group bacterium]